LLASLLDDRSFHKALLKTAAIGMPRLLFLFKHSGRAVVVADSLLYWGTGLPQLQRLKDAEGDTLRRLVLKSLIILERVLQSKESLPASSTSSLEHYLLSMETTVSANALYAQDDIPGARVEFQLCASTATHLPCITR
jgi:hypothetical protein